MKNYFEGRLGNAMAGSANQGIPLNYQAAGAIEEALQRQARHDAECKASRPPQAEIPEQFERVQKLIEEAHKCFDALEDRLVTVSSPSTPEPVKESSTTPPSLTELGHALCTVALRLGMLILRIQRQQQRLEL